MTAYYPREQYNINLIISLCKSKANIFLAILHGNMETMCGIGGKPPTVLLLSKPDLKAY